jgi:hypothetical protein
MDDPVALVEEADDGDPLVHRRDPGLRLGGGAVGRCRTGLVFTLLLLPARGKHQNQRDRPGGKAHPYSGIQGW